MLTQGELHKTLTTWQRDFMEELRRGPQRALLHASGFPSAGTLSIVGGTNPNSNLAPNKGFAWSVRRVTVRGLSTGDSIGIFRGGVLNPISGEFAGSEVLTLTAADPSDFITKGGLVIFSNEPLSVFGSSLTATGAIEIDGEAAEVPANMAGVFY